MRSRRREVEEQASRKQKLPSAAKLLEHLEAVNGQLFGDENRAAVILQQLLDGPIRLPQWCSKHWLKASERKGGGRRRRAS